MDAYGQRDVYGNESEETEMVNEESQFTPASTATDDPELEGRPTDCGHSDQPRHGFRYSEPNR